MALTAVQLFINNVIISQENSCKISSQIGFLKYKKSYKKNTNEEEGLQGKSH